MKHSTSWTHQQTAARCGKRFYFTYLDASGISAPWRSLKSVRELGGHFVHRALARMVKGIARGSGLPELDHVAREALDGFEEVVSVSQQAGPWQRCGGLQVGELHNGLAPAEEIDHWRTLIPRCIEKGRRVILYLGLRPDTSERSTTAESEINFRKNGQEHRGVLDVLIRDRHSTLVIDWKCHAITNVDLAQVRHYQEYLCRERGIPFSHLHGLAVDLIREEIMEVPYRPLERILKPRRVHTSTRPRKTGYIARPSRENCGRCPFAVICEDSMVRPERPVRFFEEVCA